MTSGGAIKWLARLERPRSIESLISEVYGEAAWFGCLLERAVADLLNFYDLSEITRDPVAAVGEWAFDTEDWTLNELLKEVTKRGMIPSDQMDVLLAAR